MSLQEIRSETIRDNLPKLIQMLTGFEKDDEHHRECEDFAFNFIRNYRSLSTNSHNVRRKIEGIQEKFRVANYGEYAEYFGNLCDATIKDPIFKNYDVDLPWSIIEFILELAHDPITSLRRNKEKISIRNLELSEDVVADENLQSLKAELEIANLPVRKFYSDSDLSEWSDDSFTEIVKKPQDDSTADKKEEVMNLTVEMCGAENLLPPIKQDPWTLFVTDTDQSDKHLCNTVQHSWWLENSKNNQVTVPSHYLEANFAVINARFLGDISKHYVHIPEPSTISEENLIREILWMFRSLVNCKIFTVNKNSINVRENVSIPSAMESSLAYFLNSNLVPHMTMLHKLSKSLDSIQTSETITAPKTLLCYAFNMQMLLKPMYQVFVNYEKNMKSEAPTLIKCHRDLLETLKNIELLYDIHRNVIIETDKCPPHVASAYLLTSLLFDSQYATNSRRANISMSLFFASIKVFFTIMDIWWTEGCLDDWQQEFVVESINEQGFCARHYSKNKDKAFFVPTKVSKKILESNFFNLLLEHSTEAGIVLNLLHDINRMGNLSTSYPYTKDNLYKQFMDDIVQCINEFEGKLETQEDTTDAILAKSEKNETTTNQIEDVEMQSLCNALTTTDKFLKFAFTSNISHCDKTVPLKVARESVDETDTSRTHFDVVTIFQLLNRTGKILPLQQIAHNSLKLILKKRIDIGNAVVMQLYQDEFMISQHLRNIRRVFLLESNDLMQRFYEKLFEQIESLESWANPFLLTSQLEDILSTKYPDMNSLFNFDIKSYSACKKDKVYEVVDEIILTYNCSREVAYIITEADIKEYNKVFCTLLKVKWGIITLENMRFPRSRKRSIPYASLTIIDLIMRRLEQLRFWMLYAMQSIHFHLMTQVLQSMGQQLEKSIAKCSNLREMHLLHKSYVKTVVNHCLLNIDDSPVRIGLEQILQLIFIVRMEWNDCLLRMDDKKPLSLDVTATDVIDKGIDDSEYHLATSAQMDNIESTYIRCHQYIANRLSKEVFLNGKTFLSGLSAAFNTSVPY